MDPFGVLASWKAKVLATEAKAVQNDWYNGLFNLDADQVELLKFIGSVSLIGLTLFLVLRFVFLRHLSADFSNRVVSIMHNFVALSYSAYLVNWSAPFAEVGRALSPMEVRRMSRPERPRLWVERTLEREKEPSPSPASLSSSR